MQFGGHHNVLEYGKTLPGNELMIYTWEDATLRELTDLVKSAQPAAKRFNARLEFALIYPDRKGRNVMRQVDFKYILDCTVAAFLCLQRCAC